MVVLVVVMMIVIDLQLVVLSSLRYHCRRTIARQLRNHLTHSLHPHRASDTCVHAHANNHQGFRA